MGTEPVEEDIPIEPGDLSFETQQALMLFSILPDKIEGMNGIWLGKEFSGIGDIFDFYEIEDRREVFELLTYIIGQYTTYYERQRQSRSRS
jgi:hypothetical protein